MNLILVLVLVAIAARGLLINRYISPVATGVWNTYGEIITAASRHYKVPRRIITGIISAESAGNPLEVGAQGEIGLMQLLPSGALADAARETDLPVTAAFSPAVNIAIGTWYLRKLYDRLGNWRAAIGRYNAITPARQEIYYQRVKSFTRYF